MTLMDHEPAPTTGANGSEPVSPAAPAVVLRRRTIDTVLTAAGALVAIVLLVAGILLTWGSNFAEDYVHDELTAQSIVFPDAATLEEDNPALVGFADAVVDTGREAEAYAHYIGGHLADVADGATYADLGGPEREARAALQEAVDAGADEDTIAELQATSDEIAGQRQTLFRGETLRGLLLSTFAWSTIGRIAGIAATAAFVAAGAMVVLVVLGLWHRRSAEPATQ